MYTYKTLRTKVYACIKLARRIYIPLSKIFLFRKMQRAIIMPRATHFTYRKHVVVFFNLFHIFKNLPTMFMIYPQRNHKMCNHTITTLIVD